MKSIFKALFLFIALTLLFTQCELFCDDCVDIPDEAFLDELIEAGVDTNGDGRISFAEAEAVIHLAVGGITIVNFNSYFGEIKSLVGIEAFTNLEVLDCSFNKLTRLDVSNNTALTKLGCGNNQLTSLDVSNNTALAYLFCEDNQLTSLDASGCTSLTELHCFFNQLTNLDISNNTALMKLRCGVNQLTSLDVSNNNALTVLDFYANKLTSLDVSSSTALERIRCNQNGLASLDVSNNTALKSLRIENMPTLYEVCVWTLPFPPAYVGMYRYGSPNVYFTTECSK